MVQQDIVSGHRRRYGLDVGVVAFVALGCP
jgi:hypothetical protein